jgi:hypothetical protein
MNRNTSAQPRSCEGGDEQASERTYEVRERARAVANARRARISGLLRKEVLP